MVANSRRPRCALCFGRPARRGSGGKPKAGVVSRAWRTRKSHYQHTKGSRSSSPSQTYVAKAHHHQGTETIACMLHGECAVYCGHDLANRVLVGRVSSALSLPMCRTRRTARAGSPCTWIVVHSSGSDQDGIVLLSELDAKLARRVVGRHKLDRQTNTGRVRFPTRLRRATAMGDGVGQGRSPAMAARAARAFAERWWRTADSERHGVCRGPWSASQCAPSP